MCYRTAVNVMFTQMSENQGIKQFKERVVASIIKEYKQIQDMNKSVRVCPEDLMAKEERDAFCAIMLIKEKRSRNFQGRSCADGRAQR